jgi:hypothetical protein
MVQEKRTKKQVKGATKKRRGVGMNEEYRDKKLFDRGDGTTRFKVCTFFSSSSYFTLITLLQLFSYFLLPTLQLFPKFPNYFPTIPQLFLNYSPTIPHLFPTYSPPIPHLFPTYSSLL